MFLPKQNNNLAAMLAWCALLFCLDAACAHASDTVPAQLSVGWRFGQKDGESLYRGVCQGCHMPHGEGVSTGAGMYPALADNQRLAGAAYPVYNVLHGRNGMPAFAGYLSDDQVAEVVNYVRTNMGNHYTDVVKVDDVKQLR